MEEEEELRTAEGEEDGTPSLDASVLLLLLKQHYRGLELRVQTSRLHPQRSSAGTLPGTGSPCSALRGHLPIKLGILIHRNVQEAFRTERIKSKNKEKADLARQVFVSPDHPDLKPKPNNCPAPARQLELRSDSSQTPKFKPQFIRLVDVRAPRHETPECSSSQTFKCEIKSE